MATIANYRDKLLQAAAVRVVPVLIPIEGVEGLPGVIDGINTDIDNATTLASGISISASSPFFTRTTAGGVDPTTITLTASLRGLTGTVTWSVVTGSATLSPSGNSVSVSGSSVTGYSVTIQAALSGYTSRFTIPKYGALSAQDQINLTNQVTGQLNTGNITGLGALALLNVINLNTQTTGALNGATQITNLGTLAYANAIAAEQIGAGTLAAGVIYAGTVNANKINGAVITGTEGIQILSSGGSSLAGIYKFGSQGFLRCQGIINLESSSGEDVLYCGGSGNVVLASNLPLEINSTSLSGSLGGRIILKGVDYSAIVNGTTNYTIRFT